MIMLHVRGVVKIQVKNLQKMIYKMVNKGVAWNTYVNKTWSEHLLVATLTVTDKSTPLFSSISTELAWLDTEKLKLTKSL